MKYLLNKKINIFILALFISIIPNITKAAFIGASAPVTATTSCNTGLSCGLVGYWTFDGKDIVNGVILDKSGNRYNGNAINIASSTFYTSGKIGQAGNFDGVDDYVEIADTNSLSFGNGTTDSAFSISLWIKPKIDSGAVLAKASSSIAGEYYLTTTGGAIYFRLVDNSASAYIGRSIPIVTGQWQQITAVYNGSGASSGISLYKNGILISSIDSSGGSYTAMENLTNTLKIGERDIGSNHINGPIDDVRIYNRALSAQEIQQLYSIGASNKIGSTAVASSTNACTTGISCGLVGYWTFDGKDISNGVLLDKSGNNNKGNFVSIASTTFYSSGKIGQAGNFDGVDDYINGTSLGLTGDPSVTISAWVRPANANNTNFPAVIDVNGTSGQGNSLILTMELNRPSIDFYISRYRATSAVSVNKWSHIVVTKTPGLISSTSNIYVNGVLVGAALESTDLIPTVSSGSYNIGRRKTGATYFAGQIDDVRVYNRALSAQEVQQLYSMGASNKLGSSATASSTTACTVGLACGLVGYWTFDGKDINTNGVLLDKSGNGKNAYKVNISTTTLNAPGKIGQGANFDGVGYVSVGDNLDLIGSPFTLSAWIYPQSYSGTSSNSPGVIDKLGTAGNYRLNVSLGLVTFGIRSSDNTFEGLSGTGNSAPLFKWTHVVVTYDNVATGKIYVNGVLNNSKTNFTVSRGDTAVPLLIGSNNNNPNSNFKGKIDDVRIYNRVLSDKEIQQLYSQSR